jgi:hypothetical protein
LIGRGVLEYKAIKQSVLPNQIDDVESIDVWAWPQRIPMKLAGLKFVSWGKSIGPIQYVCITVGGQLHGPAIVP